MKILPTLNIQNGTVVPVVGDAPDGGDLLSMIGFLVDQGFFRVALVDVDAARGQGNNRELIARAMKRFHAGRSKVFIQVGGGIRSSDQAQYFLDQGAAWIVVGTILQRSPVMVEQLLARFRPNLAAAVDARAGELLASGWGIPSGQKPDAVAGLIGAHGFKRILFMDVPAADPVRPDFETAKVLALSSRIPLYMGGSIQTAEHLGLAREIPFLHGLAVDALRLRADRQLLASVNPSGC